MTEISNQVLVSIIVPAYNVEKFISKCLESLTNQSLKDIEIIIVDDGSTDRTPEIIKEFAAKDKRIKMITQTNQKQGAARNRGLEIAAGEYISFVDSDDWVDKDYIEKLYTAITKYNADMAAASIARKKKNKLKYYCRYEEEKLYTGDIKEFMQVVKMPSQWYVPAKIYRRSLLDDIRFPEKVYYEDVSFMIRVICKISSLVTVPDITYFYVVNTNSTIRGKQTAKKLQDAAAAHIDAIEYAAHYGVDLSGFHILKEKKGLLTIKHYMDKKVYYFCGIKIYTKQEKWNTKH